MPATPCGNEGIDPCDNPIRCRRPAGHRADDGGPGWHSNGSVFWNDDTTLTWGDDTADGPFTPAMPDDELPEMEPGTLGEGLRAAQATLAKLRRLAPTEEHGAFGAVSQALQACLRAADMEGIQRSGERLERIKATEGHDRALAKVTAERDRLPSAGDVLAAVARGYAKATEDHAKWLVDAAWTDLGGTEQNPPSSMYDRDNGVFEAAAAKIRERAARRPGGGSWAPSTDEDGG